MRAMVFSDKKPIGVLYSETVFSLVQRTVGVRSVDEINATVGIVDRALQKMADTIKRFPHAPDVQGINEKFDLHFKLGAAFAALHGQSACSDVLEVRLLNEFGKGAGRQFETFILNIIEPSYYNELKEWLADMSRDRDLLNDAEDMCQRRALKLRQMVMEREGRKPGAAQLGALTAGSFAMASGIYAGANEYDFAKEIKEAGISIHPDRSFPVAPAVAVPAAR